MDEPRSLTKMRLAECWGCNLDVEELKEVNVYINQLQDQLKQRDEVIEEAIGMLDKLDIDIMQNTIIGFHQFIPRFYGIKEILQKYKGDNK